MVILFEIKDDDQACSSTFGILFSGFIPKTWVIDTSRRDDMKNPTPVK
jgi:hypothetical protein